MYSELPVWKQWKSRVIPCCSLPGWCSVVWGMLCLSHEHIPCLETSGPPPHPHECLPHYSNMDIGVPKLKSSPNNVKEILWVVFRRERFSRLKSRGKLDQVHVKLAPLSEVLCRFALNFEQDRLLEPWYLRFKFFKISLVFKRMLPCQRITQWRNSSLLLFALKCN